MQEEKKVSLTRMPRQQDDGVKPLRELNIGADPFGFQQLSDVQVKGVDWLWKPYIPRGALTLLMGDGGYGKSWATCAIAADLSQGRALPGQDALPPQKVLMIGAEDGLAQVIKPKMIALDANMDNIRASDKGFVIDGKAIAHLVRHIEEYDAAVVFFDPMVVYMGGKIDMNRSNETRSVLTLLSEVAQNANVAIVAVHHVRKSNEGSSQHKVMGSADFINGVRSGLLVDVSKAGQRYMAHIKSNWAANGPTLAYNFSGDSFQWSGEYTGQTDSAPEISLRPRGMAVQWVKDLLRAGPLPAMEVMAQANAANIPERTLTRAKRGVVVSKNVGGMWVWALEDHTMREMQEQEHADATPAATADDIIRSIAGAPDLTQAPMAPQAEGESTIAYARRVLEARNHG